MPSSGQDVKVPLAHLHSSLYLGHSFQPEAWWVTLMKNMDQGGLVLNTLRLRQEALHFADDIFKCIFMDENV